jgi:hypothetical protein
MQMDVVRLVIPAAAFLVMAGAFFGVVIARITWTDEATHAAKMKASYEAIQKSYNEIHDKDQSTIAAMRETMRRMEARRL